MWVMTFTAAMRERARNDIDKARVECFIDQSSNLMYLSVCGDDELKTILGTFRNALMEYKELPNLFCREGDARTVACVEILSKCFI